jgi:uncharacterized membrane protein
MTQFTYHPEPRWLALAGAVAFCLLLLSYWLARGRASWLQRLCLIGFRLAAVAVVIVCLLDPQRVDEKRHAAKARLAVLVDTSRSMSIQDVPNGRLAQATSWLKNDFAPVVPNSIQVSYFTFDQSLKALATLDSASATGGVTTLADWLEKLLALPGDEPLLGVVLCSDGIDTSRREPEAAARLYRRKGIPLHTFAVGTTNETHDIILENVQARRAVPNQAPTKLTLSLRAPGYANQTVPVQVRQKDRLVAAQEVKLTGGEQEVQLEFTPQTKGFQTFEVSVPAQPGEWLASNNRRLFGLEVIDPTLRVLYLEGTPRQPETLIPEWDYLKDALESDKDIRVKVLVRVKSAAGKRIEPGSKDPETGQSVYPVEHAKHGFPKTLDELLKYDVVIHSDILKESFTPEQLRNIARLVEEYGGGFVMIGGASAFGRGGYHRTILDRVIPVAMEQSEDLQTRPLQLQVPARAWQHPLMALGATPEQTQAIWTTKFPKLYGCNMVDHAKAGAIVLGQDPIRRNSSGPVLLMAAQQIGRGRSIAFTSDTTRSWGRDFETLWGEPLDPALPLSETNCDSRYYRQFWVNAVRWLAAGKQGKTNSAVTLELARSYTTPEEKVTARVKVREPQGREGSGTDVSVVLSAPQRSNITFKAVYEPVSRSYIAQVLPGARGEYTATATATRKGELLGQDQQLLVSEEVEREMTEIRAQPDLMARLAKLSGGQSFPATAANPKNITATFANKPEDLVEYQRRPLWDKAWLLGTLLGLLAVEWSLRRWKGLA